MKVTVVGSRTFPQIKLVEFFVGDLPHGVTILSGGARGVDQAAAEYARRRGLTVQEFLPDLEGCKERHEYTKKYHERNQKLVDEADLVVAFTEKDYGGTWDTIRRAIRAAKPVKIIKPSAFFPGSAEESPEAESSPEAEAAAEGEPSAREARKGQGPFQIRRVSLGSYALRRKSYISPEEWAEITADKDANPEKLAAKMLPAFLAFFEANRRFGVVHAITVPPRSRRNLDRPHVMDIVAERVAKELGAAWVRFFQPWEKSTRGRFAKHGEIEVTPEVSGFIGRVVFVLDDVTTTNFTLKASVQSLMALEIHAHGLAYVVMA